MAKFWKADPGTLPHLRWSFLQQLAATESCKGLILNRVAEHLSGQTHPDARFYKKIVYTVFKDYMIISTYQ